MQHDAPIESRGQSQSESAPLEVARRVLLRVEEGAYATMALSGEIERARLDAQGRALCTELCYGSLRRQVRIDRALAALAPRGLDRLDPSTRALLRLGAYQLIFMRLSPARAVNQVVEAVRRLRGPGLGGFANAILRRLGRDGEPARKALPPVDAAPRVVAQALADWYGLPPFLVEDLLKQRGRDEVTALCEALETPAPIWLRLNLLRGSRKAALAALRKEDITLESEPSPVQLDEAVRLASGHPFSGAAYGQGWFTAQDLGAQLVARLLLADTEAGPLTLVDGPLLDACAGVGGKTTHLFALTDGKRDIDAADSSARKLELLADHAHRLGCARVFPIEVDLLSNAELKKRLRPSYAAVLLDAPCSGVGVLRRHPEARRRLTADKIQALALLQRQLMANLASYVQVGGILVYSVCSLLSTEGPEQIATFLREHPHFRPLPPPRGKAPWQKTVGSDGALRTEPQSHDADGFYAVRLQRTA